MEERLKSGFTWRSYLALIYSTMVFQPAILWLFLMTGSLGLLGLAQWATLILFTEVARLSGKPVTKQEAAIAYLGTMVGTSAIFLYVGYAGSSATQIGWLYQIYFKNSDIANTFQVPGGTLSSVVPYWYSPASSEPWIQRTFFDPSWYPVMIVCTAWFVCIWISDLCLGLITRAIFVEVEKLPFPSMVPVAEACVTLTTREKWKFRVLSSAAVAAMIYGVLVYTVPFAGRALGYVWTTLPIPWTDWNSVVHWAAPGASFGIATDLIVLATGFILPFPICVAIFVGSFAVYFVGNALLVKLGLTAFAAEFSMGMDINRSWERSVLHAWVGPILGITVAAGILPLIRQPRVILQAFKALTGATKTEVRIPLWTILAPFIAANVGISLLTYWLVPAFPLWILLVFNVGWSFLYILIAARASGIATPLPRGIPFTRELVFIASGYPAYDIWFAPTYGGYQFEWCSLFKLLDLTDTHPKSFVKVFITILPVGLLMGFLYARSFWRVSPIPSATYPGVLIFWPITATVQALFTTRAPGIFNPLWILYGFAATAVLYFALGFLNLSATVIGMAVGVATPIPTATTFLIGAIIGKLIEKRLGSKWWNEYKGVLAAGISVGEGAAVVIGCALALIIKSTWVLPY